jgi:branched-chain amino acid transport system permease protein
VLVDALASGLTLAAVYGLAAFGLAIVFGVLDILNFAHGALLVLGAYVVVELITHGVPFWVAVPISVLVIALLGLILQIALFRHVEREHIAGLILSIGLIAIIDTVVLQIWGPDPYRVPRLVEGSVSLFGSNVPSDRLVIIGFAIVALGAAEVGIARTGWGKLLRATAEDGEAASLQGVPVARIKTITFAVGAGLAALAGALIATTTPIVPQLGENILIKAFIIIIIGGVGSTGGALVGALVLGMAEAFGVAYLNSGFAQLVPLVVLAAVLLIRPQGIFGRVAARA